MSMIARCTRCDSPLNVESLAVARCDCRTVSMDIAQLSEDDLREMDIKIVE